MLTKLTTPSAFQSTLNSLVSYRIVRCVILESTRLARNMS